MHERWDKYLALAGMIFQDARTHSAFLSKLAVEALKTPFSTMRKFRTVVGIAPGRSKEAAVSGRDGIRKV